MSDHDIIKSILEDGGLSPIGDPVKDPEIDGGFIAFVRFIHDGSGPTTNIIDKAAKKIQKEGLKVKIILSSSADGQVGDFLSASLRTSIPDLDFDLTVSSSRGIAAVWVDVKQGAEEKIEQKINEFTQNFLKQVGYKDVLVRCRHLRNLPSPTACLRVLRKHSPCSPDALTQLLHLPGFDAMTSTEVRRLLDTARRKGQVVRRADGSYILSLQCLMELGSSRDRYSPDISRALVLRRLKA